uniref:GLOBIN domain-containing protein n=1 Tax=Heterorhabditis bacteriophora TaxID=37862 RepID=A0A1I7XT39_HETBA
MSALSFSQKQALTLSWRLLRPQAPATFRKILLELEMASPKVKQIFYKAALVDAFNKDEEHVATMDVHIKLIVKFFDDLLSVLDDEAECVERMKRIGSAHAILARSCAFSSDIWEQLGEISLERICTHESVQKTREAGRAWRILLACLIDELRTGFDGEARMHRKSSSAEHLSGDEDINTKLRQLRMDYDHTVPYK